MEVRLPVVKGKAKEEDGVKDQGDIIRVQRKVLLRHQPSIQKLVRKYRSNEEDFQWATKGFTASVLHGQSIPDIQARVEDVGFSAIDVISLGADRVSIRSLADNNVLSLISEANEFFALFFTNVVPWVKKVMPFQRGAWLRLYGIPVHALNEDFFKLCVLDCGRYLRADSCSVDRERFDYAGVLIATSSFEIVQRHEFILVDGEMVEVKIVEEWGFNIREDACLFEEREEERYVQSIQEELVEDVDHRIDVNFYVDQLVEELRVEKDNLDMSNKAGGVDESANATDDGLRSHQVENLIDADIL